MNQEPLKLPFSVLNDRGFSTGLLKLSDTPGLEAKTAYRIGRIFSTCKTIMKGIYDAEYELRKKYALLDKDGKMVMKSVRGVDEPEVDPAKQSEFDEEYKKITPEYIEFKVLKIDFNEIAPAKLSPQQLCDLSPLFENLPE